MKSVNFKREVSGTMSEVITRTEAALKTAGFGVLTRIDFDKKIKEKLGHDMPPLTILGVSNPKFAYEAYMQNPDVTTIIPINVVLRQTKASTISVEIARPTAIVDPIGDDELYAIAAAADELLQGVLEKI